MTLKINMVNNHVARMERKHNTGITNNAKPRISLRCIRATNNLFSGNMMNYFCQKGMTLIELTIVLLILVALAGLAMPYMAGTSSKALCDATDVSMANIKRVIMEGYYLDTLGKFPQDLSGLTVSASPQYNLHFLFSNRSLGLDGIPNNSDDRVHKLFDPDTATGWRNGGYLQNGFILAGNFSDSAYTDPLLQDHIVVMDGWGRPIVIQVVNNSTCTNQWGLTTNENYCARLVSAGSGSGLGLENGDIETKIIDDPSTSTGDDRILYLNVPTPQNMNPSCSV
ncbi:MAG: type II secretion system protein [Methylococcales bacterium]|nr:type II secretion system protein [Methylococcales bacterium]